jgi:hypothetical protein
LLWTLVGLPLYEWLTSWLTPTPTAQPIKHNGFIQESGFRRASYMDCVFRNVSTNEYVWSVCPDIDESLNLDDSQHFPTFEAMLDNVINTYYIDWKLTGDS